MRRDRRQIAKVAAPEVATLGPLMTNAVAFWPMNEASGDRAELINDYTLTDDAAGIGSSATGHVYPTCLEVNDEAKSLTRAYAVGEKWDFGTEAFTVAFWIWCDRWPWVAGHYMGIAKTGYAPFGNEGWEVRLAYNNAAPFTNVPWGEWGHYSHIASLTGSTWMLLAFQQAADGTVSSSRDAEAWQDSNANTPSAANGTDLVVVYGDFGNPDYRLGPLMLWDRALTVADLTILYNSGDGLTYPEFQVAS